jgi:hypothetical protein
MVTGSPEEEARILYEHIVEFLKGEHLERAT